MAILSGLSIRKKPISAKEHDSRADDYYDHDARAVVCFSKLPAGAAGIFVRVCKGQAQACKDDCTNYVFS